DPLDDHSRRPRLRGPRQKVVRVVPLPPERDEQLPRGEGPGVGGDAREDHALALAAGKAQRAAHLSFGPAQTVHPAAPVPANISRTTTRSSNGRLSVPQIW